MHRAHCRPALSQPQTLGAPHLDFEMWESTSPMKLLHPVRNLVSDRLKLHQDWVPHISILKPEKPRIRWYETTRSEPKKLVEVDHIT
jgi:hypothetical protein